MIMIYLIYMNGYVVMKKADPEVMRPHMRRLRFSQSLWIHEFSKSAWIKK